MQKIVKRGAPSVLRAFALCYTNNMYKLENFVLLLFFSHLGHRIVAFIYRVNINNFFSLVFY